jgi:hypothetical protein
LRVGRLSVPDFTQRVRGAAGVRVDMGQEQV